MKLTQIFAKVLNMSLTASLVIVLVLAGRFALRKSPKVFSYALWVVVLFRLLCPVSLPSPVSLLGMLDAPVAQTEGITTTVEYVPYRVMEAAEHPQSDTLPKPAIPQFPSQQATVQPVRKPSLSATQILAYIWVAGMAVIGSVGIGRYLSFRKHLTGAIQVSPNIYVVDHMDSAFVAGLVRPRIYLPSDIPLQQMGYIIAHEQHHIRQLDHVTRLLSFAALCIHWFNPLVWLAFVFSGRDMEMSCDEAVIRKLGENIRADYSASLLNLASGRRIIAGSPLAFGEGNTKGRIVNLAKWKKPRKWVSIVSFLLCFTILTACAVNPEQAVVIRKQDGIFDTNAIPSDKESHSGSQPQEVRFDEVFRSTDGSVEYLMNVNDVLHNSNMPVVEVKPHYLSEADAKRVATALFGDTTFFEAHPLLDSVYSKKEIQEKLARWTPYTNQDAVDALYGEHKEGVVDTVKSFVSEYTELYNTAPDKSQNAPCEWKWKKIPFYLMSNSEAAALDNSKETDSIQAILKINDIPYHYTVETRDQADYKANYISAYISDGISPYFIDDRIFLSQLCRTEKPDEIRVNQIKKQADDMLKRMELGDWKIDECYVDTVYYGENAEYDVVINAVPVFNGVEAIRQPQPSELTSDNESASNYALTEVRFCFSPKGDLLDFVMHSPVDIEKVQRENVAAIEIQELVNIAKTNLSYSNSYQYDPGFLMKSAEEDVRCTVNICDIAYNLNRTRAPNTEAGYDYVPCLTLLGIIEFSGKESNTVYYRSETPITLVSINAVDGSVLHTAK